MTIQLFLNTIRSIVYLSRHQTDKIPIIMAASDAYSVYDTIELISAIGVKKSKQRIDHMIIKSFLAGVLLSFGGLFLLTVGGGGAPLAQSLGPGIHKMIQAAVFPIGLVLLLLLVPTYLLVIQWL
jgi:formate/nitrite transporter FocA (FNT family)